MCTSLASMGSWASAGSTATEWGGLLQAGAGVYNSLGDMAAGKTRAGMNRADAEAEIAYGQGKASRIRDAGKRELSTARGQASASGVKLTSGSVMEVEREIVRAVEQDAGVAMLTGERRADSLRMSADFYEDAGRNQAIDGLFGAASKWKSTRRTKAAGWDAILSSTRGTGD